MDRREFVLGALAAGALGFGGPARAEGLPLIADVHCHVFNLSDIPAAGFVLSFATGFRQGDLAIPPRVIAWFAPAVRAILAPLEQLAVSAADERRARTRERPAPLTRPADGVTERVVVAQTAARLEGARADLKRLRRAKTLDGVDDVAVIAAAAALDARGDDTLALWLEDPSFASTTDTGNLKLAGFGNLLGRAAAAIRWLANFLARLLDSVYAFAQHLLSPRAANIKDIARDAAAVQLFTPSLVDFDGYAYGGARARSTPKDQVLCMEDLAEAAARDELGIGRPVGVHPFFGFNPSKSGVMSRLEDAVGRGFLGVKLYLNTGFKPSGNTAAVDRQLSALYRYCAADGVSLPLFVHTGPFNAFTQVARGYSHPSLWEDVLHTHPTLRICFAHAAIDQPTWFADVLALAKRYPNQVFCDLANNGALEGAALERVRVAIADPEFRRSLMYGSDFYMWDLNEKPSHGYYQEVRKQAETDFAQSAPDFIDGYFGGNARRFLGLTAGAPTMVRLADWYRRKGIAPPAWLAGA